MAQNIAIERVDHIGVRVRNLDRALAFYRVLGFAVARRAECDDVAIRSDYAQCCNPIAKTISALHFTENMEGLAAGRAIWLRVFAQHRIQRVR